MAERLEIYKCEICGNIVEVLHGGKGELVCCGEAMKLYKENTTDAAVEKHVPVIERSDDKIKVTVGSTTHPMEDNHYIEWIEVISGDRVYRLNLEPGKNPEGVFNNIGEDIIVRAYCNLHGLWKA